MIMLGLKDQVWKLANSARGTLELHELKNVILTF